MNKKIVTKKTLNPRQGGSVVLDEKGKVISDSNDEKPENKVEGKPNVN